MARRFSFLLHAGGIISGKSIKAEKLLIAVNLEDKKSTRATWKINDTGITKPLLWDLMNGKPVAIEILQTAFGEIKKL